MQSSVQRVGTAGRWKDEREEKKGKEKKRRKEKNELRHGEWSGKPSEGAVFVTLK